MRNLLLFALACAAGAQTPGGTVLVRGATIHPVTSAPMEAMMLVKDGVISQIGPKITVPKGTAIVEAKGLHVYPGLISSASTLGLTEIGSVRETGDSAEIGEFQPQLRTLIAINPASEHIPVARANGITTVLVRPKGGIVAGQASLVHLDGWTWEEMAVVRSAALWIRFPVVAAGGGFRGQPRRFEDARKAQQQQVKELTEFFEDARRYQSAKSARAPGLKVDLRFEAMIPVLEGKLPVVFEAMREREIGEALDFAAAQKIKAILANIRDAGEQLARIQKMGVPVILGETQELPLEQDSPYDAQWTLPSQIHRAGISFAFGMFTGDSESANLRNLPYQPASAVPFGLPEDEALKSITIHAAKMWGVGDKIGSLETGKWADFIITTGDPLEVKTEVRRMFIRGREVPLESKHTRLYEKYLNRP